MLSEDARRERKWGCFPALRQILEGKKPPEDYYGPTSVSDTRVEELHRLLEIACLAREYSNEFLGAAKTEVGFGERVLTDLGELMSRLNCARRSLDDEIESSERLCREVYDAVRGSGEQHGA